MQVSTRSTVAMVARALDRVAAEVRDKAVALGVASRGIASRGVASRPRLNASSAPTSSFPLTPGPQQPQQSDPADPADSDPLRSYGAAVEASNHAFFTVDINGVITTWNRGAERLYGFPAEDIIGQHISLLVPDDRRNEIASNVAALRQDEAVEDLETVRIGQDGRPRDVVISISPIKSKSGEVIGSLGIAHNVTSKKLAEDKFRLAVDASPAGMIMVNKAGEIILVNREATRLFGYGEGELIGRSIDILIPPAQRSGHAHLRQGFVAKPEARRMSSRRDLRAVRKNGEEFPVEVLLNPMQTREGLIVLSVVIDVTEIKRIEREKDEFVATVSHELRTPLTSIAGSLGLLLGSAGGKLPEPVTRLVTIAHKNSQRLVRLINDVLDIEKIESGQMEFDSKPVKVRALVAQAVESARGLADGSGVRVRLDPSSQQAKVLADADRLTQVVTNLLSNAIKFSPADGEVLVSVTRTDTSVRIAVRDHGPGIPQEFRQRMFQRFAQADSADTRQKGGSGLGLSIAKQIVLRLGGAIGFADAEGGGTIFYLDLPRLAAQGRPAILDGAARPRLLICNHDPSAAEPLLRRLEHDGFDSDIASSEHDAIERTETDDYAAVLVDLPFPDGEDKDLIEHLRSLPKTRDTPIIFVSPAAASDGAAFLEVVDWLDKPVDIRRLSHALDRANQSIAGRPHILHVDDDPAELQRVAEALAATAEIVSVSAVDAARGALAANGFDLALIGIALTDDLGLGLMPHLRDADGDAIPVVVLSPRSPPSDASPRTHSFSNHAPTALDSLVTMLHRRLRVNESQRSEH
jgi:PAS domain S-box-containing protein